MPMRRVASAQAMQSLLDLSSSSQSKRKDLQFATEQPAKLQRSSFKESSPPASQPMDQDVITDPSDAAGEGCGELLSVPDLPQTPSTVSAFFSDLGPQRHERTATGFSSLDRWCTANPLQFYLQPQAGPLQFCLEAQSSMEDEPSLPPSAPPPPPPPPPTPPQQQQQPAAAAAALMQRWDHDIVAMAAERWQAMLRASLQCADPLTRSVLTAVATCSPVDVPEVLGSLWPQHVLMLGADAQGLVQLFQRYLATKQGVQSAPSANLHSLWTARPINVVQGRPFADSPL